MQPPACYRANIYKQIAIALKPGAWRMAGLATIVSKMADGSGEREMVEVKEPDYSSRMSTRKRGKVGVKDARAHWRQYASISDVVSAFSASTKRRQLSEAEAKHMSALKVQAAWRGVRGRVAAMDERIAKIEMLAADSEASERSYSGNSLSSLLLGFSAPHGESSASNISMAQKLPPPRSFGANEPPAPNTEREDRSPIPSNRPRNEVKEVQVAEDHGLKGSRVKAKGKAKALRQEMLSLEALSA